MTSGAEGGRVPDVLVRVEDLSDLMQRAVAVVGQALSVASQHTNPRGRKGAVRVRT